jgi:hypothetical protein
MSLSKHYVRDGSKQTLGSVTTGFDDTNTRDSSGRLVSSNTPDPSLLFRKK